MRWKVGSYGIDKASRRLSCEVYHPHLSYPVRFVKSKARRRSHKAPIKSPIESQASTAIVGKLDRGPLEAGCYSLLAFWRMTLIIIHDNICQVPSLNQAILPTSCRTELQWRRPQTINHSYAVCDCLVQWCHVGSVASAQLLWYRFASIAPSIIPLIQGRRTQLGTPASLGIDARHLDYRWYFGPGERALGTRVGRAFFPRDQRL